MGPLVTTDWLAGEIGRQNLKLIDASWYLPDMGRAARDEYIAGHIKGAVFLDIDEVSAADTDLPHMMPDAELFAARLAEAGVSGTDDIVVYDGLGIFSAPRLWWMIRRIGHSAVAVLDGGLANWLAEGHPVTSDVTIPAPAEFPVRAPLQALATREDVARALGEGALVLDARSAARFEGHAPEPRPGLRSGHMPGAMSLPFGELLNPDGTMKSPGALREILVARGHMPGRETITSCGSGVTAAIIVLALAVIGEAAALYDGSWAEWGLPGPTDVVTGAH